MLRFLKTSGTFKGRLYFIKTNKHEILEVEGERLKLKVIFSVPG